MTTNAIHSKLTKLRYGGSPTAEIEEVTSVKIGGVSVNAIEATHLQSTAKEFIAGLIDNGSVDFSANFTNGPVQQVVRRDMNAGNTKPFEIYIPNATPPITIGFSGFFTKLDGPDVNTDNKLEISGSIKVTGDITYS
jgi:hypothetical protein